MVNKENLRRAISIVIIIVLVVGLSSTVRLYNNLSSSGDNIMPFVVLARFDASITFDGGYSRVVRRGFWFNYTYGERF